VKSRLTRKNKPVSFATSKHPVYHKADLIKTGTKGPKQGVKHESGMRLTFCCLSLLRSCCLQDLQQQRNFRSDRASCGFSIERIQLYPGVQKSAAKKKGRGIVLQGQGTHMLGATSMIKIGHFVTLKKSCSMELNH
jgi:hypothetical protein